MQQNQSSKQTHYQLHGSKSIEYAKMLLSASAGETLETQGFSDDMNQ